MGKICEGVHSFSQSLVCKTLIAAKYIYLPRDYCKNPSIQGTKATNSWPVKGFCSVHVSYYYREQASILRPPPIPPLAMGSIL
jgi:hypothetical protein